MAAQPVEWVLVVYYGTAAHQPIYGRKVGEGGYSKDYIQLPPRPDFLEEVKTTFRVQGGTDSLPLTFKWPAESAPGEIFFRSSDRPHLAWKTRLGAPQVWKMSLAPSESTAETIPGDPNHRDFDAAENELAMLGSRGAGQPYLFAIKLRDEPNTLHLRVYLKNPDEKFAWANLSLVPEEVQALASKTSRSRASKSSPFQSGGVPPGAKIEAALSRHCKFRKPLISDRHA